VWAFRKENARVLAELKRHVETHDLGAGVPA
jgi:hypothetical protein